ncbi:MAG: hypothetical protein ABSE13_02675 [Methanoregula sp.]|jgi:hypothetical protein
MTFTSEGLWYAFWFTVVVALFFLIPYCIDLWWTYTLAAERDKIVHEMMKSSMDGYLSKVKGPDGDGSGDQAAKTIEGLFDAVMANLKEPIEGLSGFTRGMIAFAVILILAIATMLILFATSADSQVVNNIISMLGATLAAVVGFYFGGRTTQDAMNSAKMNTQDPGPAPSLNKEVTPTGAAAPVLKVNGIKIGKTAVFENGAWIPKPDVDIYGYWDTLGKTSLELSMDPETQYSLYCNIESSIPDGQYEIYTEPTLVSQKDSETRPFIDGRQNFIRMLSHPKHNTWYVKDFAWFPKYKNLRDPGDYLVVIKKGYLKPGHPVGAIPIWTGTEEFRITLK